MLKKFAEGLVFGGGFAISFVVIWFMAAYLISPMFIASRIAQEANRQISGPGANVAPSKRQSAEAAHMSTIPFHELGLEDQIRNSSAIALARYERAADGRMKAVIREFLKKDSNATIYYKIGDEYPSAGYYPKDDTSYGDGVVIFFTGSPATMKMSMTYSGDRIRGLGDLPVELLRRKCKDPNAERGAPADVGAGAPPR